eukprot:GEMP01005812.1.p1 GENE.GEMP01005812.1~~GEMP01005812.1.p1  ORF type:complete len:905 (+),score=162.92 GEMP01005812.1:391-3105(+)
MPLRQRLGPSLALNKVRFLSDRADGQDAPITDLSRPSKVCPRYEAVTGINKPFSRRRHSLQVAHCVAKGHSRDDLAPEPELSTEDLALVRQALKNNLVCASLNDHEINMMCCSLGELQYNQHEDACVQNQQGTHFFIARDGVFDVMVDGKKVRELHKGDTFGEIALIHSCPQTATVTCASPGGGSAYAVPRTHFRSILKRLAARNFLQNRRFLDSVDIFQYLTDSQKNAICQALIVQMYTEGARIVQQGEKGDADGVCMFILKSGELSVHVEGKGKVGTLLPGDFFGERSLLYGEPRSASVDAEVNSICLAIHRNFINKVLGDIQHVLFRNIMTIAMRDTPEFCEFTKSTLANLAEVAVVKSFNEGDLVVSAKHPQGVRSVIVLEGSVTANSSGEVEPVIVERGECFGGAYVLYPHKPWAHDIVANVSGRVAVLTTEGFSTCFGEESSAFLDHNTKMAVLRKIFIFRYLPNTCMRLLAKSFKSITRTQGQNIITENELGSQFFIVAQGEVEVTKNGERVRTLGQYDYFGERALLYDEPRTVTVRCHSPSEVGLWVIDQTVFRTQIMQKALLEYLAVRIALQHTDFKLSDLSVDRVVGKGTFGTVKLVKHKTTKTRYALKCVLRASVIEHHVREALQHERNILTENDHPFLIKLVRTFKDAKYLYFLMELVTGGELYESIRAIGLLSKPTNQFYLGSMILALESLHQRNIVYRDLKPENIIIDAQGYIKLIDFGCSKKMIAPKTFTFVGTPHYIAPEVIADKGYSFSVDLWSLGVCAYEFMCGPLPFGDDTDDQIRIFRAILTGKLAFPCHCNEDRSMDFVKRLLCRVPELRLGCSKHGMADVRDHPFFEGFDFDLLLGRAMTPPLVPTKEVYQADSGKERADASGFFGDSPPPDDSSSDWEKEF